MFKSPNFRFKELLAHPQLSFLSVMAREMPKSEWFLVGGAVRDVILGRIGTWHDFDFVVRGVGLDEVSKALSRLGKVDYVGRDFGVLKFRPNNAPQDAPEIDIAWPRTERSGGSGSRKDFFVDSDPELPIIDDLARRDFTINAMAWDIAGDRIFDPFDGMADIEVKLVRAVGVPEDRFHEDCSRMLRAVRFACQLGFDIEGKTWGALMRSVGLVVAERKRADGTAERVLPYETVAKEFLKALKADPVRAIDLFESAGVLFLLVPELARTVGVAQPSRWHTEGDVWQHTKMAVAKLVSQEFREFFSNDQPTVETAVAVLLHDTGKPDAAVRSGDGRISFHGHDVIGERIARSVTETLRLSSVHGIAVRPERVAWLVRNHLFPVLIELDHVRHTTLHRYFLHDAEAGRQLLQVAFADISASVPEGGAPDLTNLRRLVGLVGELRSRAESEDYRKVTGKDVMDIAGVGEGPAVGRLLEELHEAQLRGEVADEDAAKEFLRKAGRGE